ncbi:hypothetical protein [Methylobacterium tardum]|uniref:hypothetical protein n=1 Tax=Methylobacterium tardum TaxID=374432 RepID=UPI001EDF85D1|nr:hypothetical protein [Methylobacterium tardum]
MSYLGGHTFFRLEGDPTGTWLDRHVRHRPQREAVSGFPTGPSEQVLREIAQMDREVAAKLAARRFEQRSTVRRPSKQLVGRPA